MIAVGVDTHKDSHLAVALDRLGQVLGELVVEAGAAGYRELERWAAGLAADGQELAFGDRGGGQLWRRPLRAPPTGRSRGRGGVSHPGFHGDLDLPPLFWSRDGPETHNAWALLLLASGEDVEDIHPSVRSRLRRALRVDGLEKLAPRLVRRAESRYFDVHPGELRYLAEDPAFVRTGISAAGEHGLDLVAGHEADGYIAESSLEQLVACHALSAAGPGSGSVRVRVVSDTAWRHLDGQRSPRFPRSHLTWQKTQIPALRRLASGCCVNASTAAAPASYPSRSHLPGCVDMGALL